MAPRPEELMETLIHETAASNDPNFGKEKEFAYESRGITTMPSFGRKHDDKTLLLSFQELSDCCSELFETLSSGSSPTLDACRGSLQTDMIIMLHETNMLLKNVEQVTPWRASLAQARVDSYLETIQGALKSRHHLDGELGLVANSIASQIKSNSESKTSDDLAVRVSAWRTPSLCFDLDVSEPVEFLRIDSMPINVRARAIAEIYAKDMPGSIPQYNACLVRIEDVKHDYSNPASLAGTVGEALIKIRIIPFGDAQKKKATWGEDEDVGFVRVIEARVVQINAFSPLPKRTVDLFTSSNHGTSDITVTLRFKTHRLMKPEDIPEVNIELVMGSS